MLSVQAVAFREGLPPPSMPIAFVSGTTCVIQSSLMPLVQISVPHTSTTNLRHKSVLMIWSWNVASMYAAAGSR